MSQAGELLQRAWWSFDLPGYRESGQASTYAPFPYETLPPVNDPGNIYAWLTAEPIRPHSIVNSSAAGSAAASSNAESSNAASSVNNNAAVPANASDALARFRDLMPSVEALLPSPFRTFTRVPGLAARVRSCTDCFLEAPDYLIRTAEPAEGWLVHFLSDSQWVLHWYLHIQPDGEHFVAVSTQPIGFREGEKEPDWDWANYTIPLDQQPIWYCAPSFSEFIFRFWLENEIWFALTENKPLTKRQKAYLEGMGKS